MNWFEKCSHVMCSLGGFVLILVSSLLLNSNDLHFNEHSGNQLVRLRFSGAQALQETKTKSSAPSSSMSPFAENPAKPREHHIEIIRNPRLFLNGIQVTEENLLDHLEEHERELIFGNSREKRSFQLVDLRHHPDVRSDSSRLRSKRSAEKETGAFRAGPENVLQIRDSEDLLDLKLEQSEKLIDDAFVFIRSYKNSTELIENSQQLAKKYAQCFYRNEHAALDFCEQEKLRGIFHHKDKDFIIHPLPDRFGNSSHLIYERRGTSYRRSLDLDSDSESDLDLDLDSTHFQINENFQFEPDKEDFNEPSSATSATSPVKRRRNSYEAGNETKLHLANHHKKLHLNLRYKPRYHHTYPYTHPHHHKHHHVYQHQHKNHQNHDRRSQRRLHLHKKWAGNDLKTEEIHQRHRRFIPVAGDQWKIPQVLHIETAIFVDSDLIRHMSKNFPKDTESHLMRFVLAIINGVQILYHHPSLGRRVNFVLKRLQVMVNDPLDLRRSSDIDTYLSSFCLWQKKFNPLSDSDTMHYDHAVILTGLDLYVVGKNGKVTSQVVGLAPVAGMCTETSSCTINEGKHFESVFVVAHEIGHNLGMRHDTNENSCDSSLFIMSPTLGSGKTTWSKCSRTYLNSFLETRQAQCLFDRGQFVNNLDHSAEGILPGERFDANQQCMLKYGQDSERAKSQSLSDICRDLHCRRDRYTWTSHPALEGTECGDKMYCRSGTCVMRPTKSEAFNSLNSSNSLKKPEHEKRQFLESSKMGHLLQEFDYNKNAIWGDWSEASDCDSGCLYGPNKRLKEGSTGLKISTRSCLDYRRRCLGKDRKFETCIAKLCYKIPTTTIEQFATTVCEKAQKFDAELTGEGLQLEGDLEESCKVFCKTKTNGTKSRSWTFPDGTTCHSKNYRPEDISYCIAGRCEKFSCDNSTNNYYKMDAQFCQYLKPSKPSSNEVDYPAQQKTKQNDKDQELQSNNQRNVGVIYGPTTIRNKYENEVAVRSFHGTQHDYPYVRKSDGYNLWKSNYPYSEPRMPPKSASLVALSPPNDWVVKSGCHSSCMAKSKGLQVVASKRTSESNIQLCTHSVKPCERLLSTTEFAENVCARYKLKVRGLSGYGSQIAASVTEPDRSCRVGCQDEFIKYRFYLVNGRYGHFPLGTKCSNTEERYCVNGKCLEFDKNGFPLQESHVSLALFRNRREIKADDSSASAQRLERTKRSFLFYDPVNITERITQDFINNIVNSIITMEKQDHFKDEMPSPDHIEFNNPIHIAMDELSEH